MKRFAIYARYSDDLQNPKSIDDQISEARAVIEKIGGIEVALYSDAARSGAHTAQRPEYQRMFRQMRDGLFDAIIGEDMDRLTRSLKEAAGLWDEAEHVGIELWTTSGGHIRSLLEAGFRGLMGQDFLRNLAVKTRRGLIGVVKRGGFAGGRCYGYDVSGRAKRSINEDEAMTVRRIYDEYSAGKSPRAIVRDLNKEGTPAPRGGKWAVSTLVGSAKRRNGLLNNPIYRGELLFNRQAFRKDPKTGKRVSRPNDESKWIRENHPDLAIVDAEAWEAAQKRRAMSNQGPHPHHNRRPATLLSGLVKCRMCGSPMAKTGDYFRCTSATNRGICRNNRGTSIETLEKITIDAVKATLADPVLVARFAEVFRREVEIRLADHNKGRELAQKRLAEINTKIGHLTRALETGLDSDSVRRRVAELETDRRAWEAKAVPAPDNIKRLIPDAHVLAARQAANENLTQDLRRDDLAALKLREEFRGTIADIRTGPTEDGRMAIEVDGNIKGLLGLAGGPDDSVDWVGCGNRI